MVVLSLFDGISCGQLALQRAGIPVSQYMASEIDHHAIQITTKWFPRTIQMGSVADITAETLPYTPDILIGGSPCQGFSFAGKQLNFDDPRSALFFEYIRLKNQIKPRWFLLENVPMKREYQDVISELMGTAPVRINSAAFSAHNRPRLYWTNIPVLPIPPEDSAPAFNRYLFRLGHGYITDAILYAKKYPSLAAQSPATKYRIVEDIDVARTAAPSELRRNAALTRSASPEECEEFQTLPVGYTAGLTKTRRYAVIGNGWTVDTVAHIFKGIPALERH